jgi:hypothetical protein
MPPGPDAFDAAVVAGGPTLRMLLDYVVKRAGGALMARLTPSAKLAFWIGA